jgi:hypothetical protein
MPIQRSGACDQRRRRVLMEDHLHGEPGEAELSQGGSYENTPPTVRLPGRRYGEEASADHQQPFAAIVPKRPLTVILILIAGLLSITATQAIYGRVSLLPEGHWLRAADSLDVERAGSVACWLSSCFLLAAAVLGFQIYRLRRHRSDDYRGRYRVWVWVSPLLLLASMVLGTHLHQDLLSVLAARSPAVASIEPRIFSMVLPTVIWLLIAFRLMFEVRESRAAWMALAFASSFFVVSMVIGLWAPPHLFSLPAALTISGASMMGYLTVLMTVACFSRYVYLDAHGLLAIGPQAGEKPRRKRSSARKQVAAAGETDRDGVAAEAGVDLESAPSDRAELLSGNEAVAERDDAADGVGASKSERRRQKKEKRREALRKAA